MWLKINCFINEMYVRWLGEIKDFWFDVTHLQRQGIRRIRCRVAASQTVMALPHDGRPGARESTGGLLVPLQGFATIRASCSCAGRLGLDTLSNCSHVCTRRRGGGA